jgi:hypothetical protein
VTSIKKKSSSSLMNLKDRGDKQAPIKKALAEILNPWKKRNED